VPAGSHLALRLEFRSIEGEYVLDRQIGEPSAVGEAAPRP
jgi:hypothetical protein